MQASINLRALNAINLAASSEDARYYLQGVKVEISERATIYVATNGHILAAYRDELAEAAESNTLLGEFIIPSHICKVKLPKRGDIGTLSQLADGEFRIDSADGATLFKPVAGTFPDWRRVVPRKCDGKVAQFDGVYTQVMQQIGWIMNDTKPSKHSSPTNRGAPSFAHNGDNPTLVGWYDNSNLFGVIMPFRGFEPTLPTWVDAQPDPVAQAAE